MSEALDPPVTKYKFTAVIRGNTHAEIVNELVSLTRGGYLLASDYEKRDEFDSYGGRDHITLEHTNPDMTPERYAEQLEAWAVARKLARKAPK
jgi:hypothetical protein